MTWGGKQGRERPENSLNTVLSLFVLIKQNKSCKFVWCCIFFNWHQWNKNMFHFLCWLYLSGRFTRWAPPLVASHSDLNYKSINVEPVASKVKTCRGLPELAQTSDMETWGMLLALQERPKSDQDGPKSPKKPQRAPNERQHGPKVGRIGSLNTVEHRTRTHYARNL